MVGLPGSDRGAFHGNLTAAEAETVLALPVFHVLAGHAFLSFPGSTVSRPSRFVEIKMGSRYTNLFAGFPVRVNLNQYRKAVLPVLRDPSNDTLRPINLADIQEGHPIRERYLERLGQRLRQSFEAAGF